ncbi:MAG TPA: HAD-IA family hydrolase [Bacillota bacterium]|mgnify:CR=1 FL=1|nr:HAD-IA family hydrolase [Bacillota bacterium]
MTEKKGKSKFDTVIFDFDGTIMDTNNIIIDSWQHTFRTIEGRERPVEEIIGTFGEPLGETMARLLPGHETQVALDIYRSYHRDSFKERITIFPGMMEVLSEIKKRGYKTGLVTSRLAVTTAQGLSKYDLWQYFDAVVTMEDCKKHKPDPEPLEITLKKLCSKPEKSIMLGDTMHDITCAKNAGVESVLVGWAIAVKKDEIKSGNGPDHIIEKADDLLEILEG